MHVRDSLKKIRDYQKGIVAKDNKTTKKGNIRTQINNIKKLYEEIDKSTQSDIDMEANKMNRYFANDNVLIDYEDLVVYDDVVYFGGTIDNQLQFVYKVAEDEEIAGVELNFLDDFNADNEDNKEIIDKVEKYYDIFFRYWKENYLNTNEN